ENNLHAFVIAQIRDFDKCVETVNDFLPHINNWATCDSLRPAVFGKHKDKLLKWIKKWMASAHEYTVRFGIEMLMTHYLDEGFSTEHLKLVSSIKRDEYYIKMMIAWYFATALAKQYSDSIHVIESRILDKWTHNKTIQKAIESYRVREEHKIHLRSLSIKEITKP
ncbi:MAG: DNA alkylation repair protein, partial [Bacteroidales bacterium]|nr:DNA alkylation repair protein [Bacteroidales bacterium]